MAEYSVLELKVANFIQAHPKTDKPGIPSSGLGLKVKIRWRLTSSEDSCLTLTVRRASGSFLNTRATILGKIRQGARSQSVMNYFLPRPGHSLSSGAGQGPKAQMEQEPPPRASLGTPEAAGFLEREAEAPASGWGSPQSRGRIPCVRSSEVGRAAQGTRIPQLGPARGLRRRRPGPTVPAPARVAAPPWAPAAATCPASSAPAPPSPNLHGVGVLSLPSRASGESCAATSGPVPSPLRKGEVAGGSPAGLSALLAAGYPAPLVSLAVAPAGSQRGPTGRWGRGVGVPLPKALKPSFCYSFASLRTSSTGGRVGGIGKRGARKARTLKADPKFPELKG